MSGWPDRVALIVAAEEQEAANTFAFLVGDGGQAEMATFSVELSPTGQSPATHYGCSTLTTEAMRTQMLAVLGLGLLPSARFYRTDAESGVLQATNSATATVGQAWDWAASLTDVGLAVVQPAGLV